MAPHDPLIVGVSEPEPHGACCACPTCCEWRMAMHRVEAERNEYRRLHDASHELANHNWDVANRLQDERDRLRALLREVRESYRRPWDYGWSAVIETDQSKYAAWLAKLDAALED